MGKFCKTKQEKKATITAPICDIFLHLIFSNLAGFISGVSNIRLMGQIQPLVPYGLDYESQTDLCRAGLAHGLDPVPAAGAACSTGA